MLSFRIRQLVDQWVDNSGNCVPSGEGQLLFSFLMPKGFTVLYVFELGISRSTDDDDAPHHEPMSEWLKLAGEWRCTFPWFEVFFIFRIVSNISIQIYSILEVFPGWGESFHSSPAEISYKQPFSMLYKVCSPSQRSAKLLFPPAQSWHQITINAIHLPSANFFFLQLSLKPNSLRAFTPAMLYAICRYALPSRHKNKHYPVLYPKKIYNCAIVPSQICDGTVVQL